MYDVFFSYHHADQRLARRLLTSLEAAGLDVFFDQACLEDFASISGQLVTAIESSKAFLALYSRTYPTRRACQFELTAAFLASQREGDPRSRVLVVNPSSTTDHIEPVELRDALFRFLPVEADEAAIAATARAVADHVARVSGALGSTQPLQTACWLGRKPAASPTFVGRIPDLWKVHSALQAGDLQPITGVRGPGLAQLIGMPGIGKTMLAEEYALRFGDAYPSGVFWLNASWIRSGEQEESGGEENRSEAARNRQLRQLAAELEIPTEALENPVSAEIALRQELGSREQPYLWIVDDLQAGLELEELRSWLAPTQLGKTLLVTRGRDYESSVSTVELGVLPPDDALQLLTRRRGPSGADERREAEKLAEELGFHALALTVAAAAIAAGAGDPYRALRTELGEEDDDALEFAAELTEVLPTDHHPSIAKTLLSSIRRLGPPGLDVLRLASRLSDFPILPKLVDEVFTSVDQLSTVDGRRRGMKARAEVHRLALVSRLSDNWSFGVHPLIRRTMRFAERTDSTRTDELEKAVVIVLARLLAEEGSHPDVDEQLVPHARHLISAGPRPDLRLLALVGGHDLERGTADSAVELFGKAVEISEAEFGKNHPETLQLLERLGTAHRILGHFNPASSAQARVVAGRREALGPGHPSTLDALLGLGSVRYAQGEFEAARTIEEEVLALRLRSPGRDHPSTLETMEDLALTLRVLGDLDRARDLQIAVLNGRVKLYGEGHRHTLTAVANLAWTHHLRGEYRYARSLGERVLVGRVDLFGLDHVDTLKAMGNLGATFESLGDLGSAFRLTAKMVDGQCELLRSHHPDTLTGMSNLAGILRKRGDLAGAYDFREEVASGRTMVLGPHHPATLRAASALSESLADQGYFDRARDLQESVLAVQIERVTEDNSDVALGLERLASVMHKLKNQKSALALQKRAWRIRKKILGEDHPATLFSLLELAELEDGGDSAVDEMARIMAEKFLRNQPNVRRDENPAP